MPYPAPIDTFANENFAFDFFQTPRTLGPYQFVNWLYLFQHYIDNDEHTSWVRAYRSTDAGMNWSVVGEGEDDPLPPKPHATVTMPIATCQSGSTVVVAFCTNVGDDEHVAFAEFDMVSGTWSEMVVGPQVYFPGEGPGSGLVGGITSYWDSCNPSVVKRPDGSIVILMDNYDGVAIEPEGGEDRYFRQTSLFIYDGSWETVTDLFGWDNTGGEIDDKSRETMPGSLVLGDDGTVHIFVSSVLWDNGDPLTDDLELVSVVYRALFTDNTLQFQHTVGTGLETEYYSNVVSEAVFVDGRLYVAYRTPDHTITVSGGIVTDGILDYTPQTVSLPINEDNIWMLNATLVVSDGQPHLVWTDVIPGSGDIPEGLGVYSSSFNGEEWSVQTPQMNLGEWDTAVEDFNGRAFTGGVGLSSFIYSNDLDGFYYYQFTLGGPTGPTSASRYRGYAR